MRPSSTPSLARRDTRTGVHLALNSCLTIAFFACFVSLSLSSALRLRFSRSWRSLRLRSSSASWARAACRFLRALRSATRLRSTLRWNDNSSSPSFTSRSSQLASESSYVDSFSSSLAAFLYLSSLSLSLSLFLSLCCSRCRFLHATHANPSKLQEGWRCLTHLQHVVSES